MRSTKLGKTPSKIKMINDEIIAAADDDLLMLNCELETVERYNGIARLAQLFDGNKNHIAMGLQSGVLRQSVRFFPRSGDEQEVANPTVSRHRAC